MSKRSFPFNNGSPLQLKTHVESKHVNNNDASLQKIYSKTESVLRAGAKAQAQISQAKENIVQKTTTVCANCNKTTSNSRCWFCDKEICVYCSNICHMCEEKFCPLCSLISYADPVEKAFCLTCTGE